MKRSNYALAIDLLVYIRNRLNQEADKCKRLNKSCPDEKYVYAANLCVQILDDIKKEKKRLKGENK